MPDLFETPQDTGDLGEKEGNEAAASKSPKPKDAFAELMSANKPRYPKNLSADRAANAHKTDGSNLNVTYGRDALVAYIKSPTSFPSSRVISHSADFVLIVDAYPKSSVHLLILPRDLERSRQHPFQALADEAFLAQIRDQAAVARKLAASELRRLYARFSYADAARYVALDADPPVAAAELPSGRDWEAEVMVGVHAVPSMNHLHVHVISRDRYSECLLDRKHYNSFSTPFLVPLDDFPLAADDVRRHPDREGYMRSELICWRCSRNFGNKFKALKEHLVEEFEEWKKE